MPWVASPAKIISRQPQSSTRRPGPADVTPARITLPFVSMTWAAAGSRLTIPSGSAAVTTATSIDSRFIGTVRPGGLGGGVGVLQRGAEFLAGSPLALTPGIAAVPAGRVDLLCVFFPLPEPLLVQTGLGVGLTGGGI